MARFMISMPDDMLKKLDEAARKEHRSRSELLREVARRHLTADVQAEAGSRLEIGGEAENCKENLKGSLRERLLNLGVGQRVALGSTG